MAQISPEQCHWTSAPKSDSIAVKGLGTDPVLVVCYCCGPIIEVRVWLGRMNERR